MSNEYKDWIRNRYEEQEQDIEYIYEFLARNFGEPCIWSFDNIDVYDYIFERDDTWCDKNCGNVPNIECWRKYLELRIEEEMLLQ